MRVNACVYKLQKCLFIIVLKQPSAKWRTLEFTQDSESLMGIKNKRGPKTVPCGTPDFTLAILEKLPSTMTRCLRLFRFRHQCHSAVTSQVNLHGVLCRNFLKSL